MVTICFYKNRVKTSHSTKMRCFTNKTFWRFRLQAVKFHFKTIVGSNTIKMKRKVRRIHWYMAKKENINDTKVIKD